MSENIELPKIKLSKLLNEYPNFDFEIGINDIKSYIINIEEKTSGLITPSKLIGILLTLGLTFDNKGENTQLIEEIAAKLMN